MFQKYIQSKLEERVKEMTIEDFLALKFGETKIESQKRFINFLVKDLFNTIDENDILTEKPGGKVIYQGVEMSGEMISQLRHDAQTFGESVLWEVLNKEIKYLANLRMFEIGKTDEDLLAGKCILWTLKVINGKIKELSKKR